MDDIIEKISRIIEIINRMQLRLDEILKLINIDLVCSYERVKHLIEISKGSAAQRTKEWYMRRNGCITASAVHDILKTGNNNSISKFVQEKCGRNFIFTNRYVEWGNKYEDIAVSIFERMYDVEIFDAPLLLHEVFPFFGASCDGFVLDHKNKKGYLIEIKCPYSRKPDGLIPNHYYEQPQMQSSVTYVKECAFFDCKLAEYNHIDKMIEDNNVPDCICKGWIINYTLLNDDGTCTNKFWNSKKYIIFGKLDPDTNNYSYDINELLQNEKDMLATFNKEMENVNYFFKNIHGWKLFKYIRDEQM